MSAAELADRLDAVSQGNALIRTKLEVRSLDGAKRVLQLQIKQRRTKTATDLVYQVLWPNEHKGEAVILHQAQGAVERLDHRSAATGSRDQVLANERGIVRQRSLLSGRGGEFLRLEKAGHRWFGRRSTE